MRQNNNVQLVGYVGNDPIIKVLKNGKKQARLQVATHHVVKKEDAEKTYATTWHQVIAWDDTAEYAERSFLKGSHIMVDGRIVYRTYPDTNGHTRYVTEIKAISLTNLDR